MRLAGTGARWIASLNAVCAFLLLVRVSAFAEKLPIKVYTTADGLARDQINRIVQDSRGFLWFCTDEGLSRFDGYTFSNYAAEQGLPSRAITDFLETRSGVYWVATQGGLCRFNPSPSSQRRTGGLPAGRASSASDAMFAIYYPGGDETAPEVNTLFEDSSGQVWCGTSAGLYRIEETDGDWSLRPVDLGIPSGPGGQIWIVKILEDRRGTLWVSTGKGLYRRWPDGRTERYTESDRYLAYGVRSLLEDRQGRLWVGLNYGGLCQLVADPRPDSNIIARHYTTKEGLGDGWVRSLVETSDGHIWAGTNLAVSELAQTAGGDWRVTATYTAANGLRVDDGVNALTEDRDGNLWIGATGATRLARDGFTTYGEADGLERYWVTSVVEDRAGELCTTYHGGDLINRFDGRRFTSTRPRFPRNITYFGWPFNQATLQDSASEWWIPTGQGLCRFPRVNRVEDLAHTPPIAVYTTKDGLPGDEVFRLFEDSWGDIWISSIGRPICGLTRWERATGTLHPYGWPQYNSPVSFCEDASGRLWIGTADGVLARRDGQRFTVFTATDGVPPGWILALHTDHMGRLWIASSRGGLCRIDEPGANHPRIVTYTTADGLSSNQVRCFTEDQWGRVYAGTGRGVDRMDPASGRIKHYTSADGLPEGRFEAAFRDRRGALWFASTGGLSRLIPQPDRPQTPPPILISGLRIGGDPRPLSALGETEVRDLVLNPGRNQVQIDFVGLGFGLGEALRYQYMLEGADRDWSPATDQRTVNYASLQPGRYRFRVRALTADGTVSDKPSVVAFRILPPVWQRWYFLGPAALLIGLMIYGLYRYRLARLIEMERVRTRIATDLHDDIGANLTRIALLSEVANQQPGNDRVKTLLPSIADIARESVASMNDIVWAISPEHDSLVDLTRRMRRHAEEVFALRDIDLDFAAPTTDGDLKLSVGARRDFLLIFKEAVNNAARHSLCTKIEIELRADHSGLRLKIKDDGQGFNPAVLNSSGLGLRSMQRRAASLGGTLRIQSGAGTTVEFALPLRKGTASH